MSKHIALISLILLTSVSTHLTFMNYGDEDTESCWVKAYGRGVGKPISDCPDGLERDGLLCYPKCAENYTGVGPVCWQNCPSNFRNDGAFCFKPAPYGRGSGYALWDEDKCNRENPQGCERWGLMWYPRCAAGYHNVDCCICSPDCPAEMTDIGISCAKHSYGRGAGIPMTCHQEEEYDSGLCYPYCKQGYRGVGPICWGQCPENLPQCGALCLKEQACTNQIKDYFTHALDAIIKWLESDTSGGFIDFSKFIKELIYPICKNPEFKALESQ
jgi:hypothetical protein